jgi:hypothetical protein
MVRSLRRTQEDFVVEERLGEERILLDVAFVIVVGTIVLGLEGVSVGDHFNVQFIEAGMRDDILDHDKAVAVESANSDLKVHLRKFPICGFLFRRLDRQGFI